MKWLTVPAAAVVGWFIPARGLDAQFDWIATRAIVDGHNPYATLGELASHYGMDWNAIWAHPRLPGAHLLQLPYTLIPFEHVGDFGKAVVCAALAATFVLIRPPWWVYAVLAYPIWSTVNYANTSAIVTLLIAVWYYRGSSTALGIATVLRGWPWFIIACLFITGRRREAVQAGGVFAGLNLVGLLLPEVTIPRMVDGFTLAREVEVVSVNLARGMDPWIVAAVAVGVILFLRAFPRFLVLSVPYALILSPVLWVSYFTVLAVPIGDAVRRPAPDVPRSAVVARP